MSVLQHCNSSNNSRLDAECWSFSCTSMESRCHQTFTRQCYFIGRAFDGSGDGRNAVLVPLICACKFQSDFDWHGSQPSKQSTAMGYYHSWQHSSIIEKSEPSSCIDASKRLRTSTRKNPNMTMTRSTCQRLVLLWVFRMSLMTFSIPWRQIAIRLPS